MASGQLTVETVPADIFVEERGTSRRLDFSFEIRNGGGEDIELLGIEQAVYDADGALVQPRLVDENGSPVQAVGARGRRVGSGRYRLFRNPLPEFAAGTPLVRLVYRFHFRTPDGRAHRSAIRLSPVERGTPALAPEQPPALPARPEQPCPPTPRQLARAWFETLYELPVYATA